jgi:hypothetical protein
MRNTFDNKFAHHNVQAVGTNVYNWVNTADNLLNEHIEQAMDNGYTRLEITCYRQKEREGDQHTNN